LITVFVGGFQVINGHATIGNIAEFVIYVNMLMWPVASLGYTSSLIQRAAASQARINEFLSIKPEIVNSSTSEFQFKESIEFKNVSFTFPGKHHHALKNINFKLNKGEKLGILGSTGSGKSTIATLLLRLYDPTSGEILVDGKNLKEINLEAFKQQIGYVPQDVFLFSDTISNNILFGNEKATREEMIQAAEWADIKNNIESFTEGFETMVGERGITLSGGQKQRVAIARALIKKPEILILDDCLSAVDTKTESTILKNLDHILKDKTAIIISHRVSSIKNADYIIVLHDGEIEEAGTHETLLQMELYAKLYYKQEAEKLKTY
jgi:ATP-binding cassette subfamily B protein